MPEVYLLFWHEFQHKNQPYIGHQNNHDVYIQVWLAIHIFLIHPRYLMLYVNNIIRFETSLSQ